MVTQNLPFGLTLSPHDQISLLVSSSNLTNVTTSGNFLSGFNAFGTSDINGTSKSQRARTGYNNRLDQPGDGWFVDISFADANQAFESHAWLDKHHGPSAKTALFFILLDCQRGNSEKIKPFFPHFRDKNRKTSFSPAP